MTWTKANMLLDDSVNLDKLNDSVIRLVDKNLSKYKLENKIVDAMLTDVSKWTALSATQTLIDNQIKFTPTGSFGNVSQTLTNLIDGHKYYVSALVKTTGSNVRVDLSKTDGTAIALKGYGGSGNFERLSFVATINGVTTARFRVMDYVTSDFKEVTFTEPMLIDLTDIFGVGNEPTINQLEATLKNANDAVFFANHTSIVLSSIDKIAERPIYAKLNNGVIDIISKYSSTHDMRYKMGRKGVNNLFDFISLHKIANSNKYVSADVEEGVIFLNNGTDFFAPHRLRAVNNADGDKAELETTNFTGGNHGYDNTGTIAPSNTVTARSTILKYLINGIEYDHFEGYCDRVDIYWTNYVQASNTMKLDGSGREVLKENYHLIYDGFDFKISCSIEFLEDCSWLTYYGVQSLRSPWTPNVYYHSAGNKKMNTIAGNSDAWNKNATCITLSNSTDALDIAVDKLIGLGKSDMLTSVNHNAFCNSSKVYYYLVDSKNVLANEIYTFEAKYRFYSK